MKCFWIFNHDFEKWGNAVDSHGAKIKQARVCKQCGLIQVRTIGYEDGLYADGVDKSLQKKELQ